MIFSRATLDDIAAMSAIRLLVKENVLSNPARITQQMYVDYLDKLGRGWVCKMDGVVVGFSYAASADASIWALFVHPDFEGRGIGKQLLALATGWLFAGGASAVGLSTGANTRAARFYAAQGWQSVVSDHPGDLAYSLPAPSPVSSGVIP